MIDYYAVLQIEAHASSDEVVLAYRRLATRHHPDRNPDDATSLERFKTINEAHTILADPQRRSRYDRLRGTPRRARARQYPDLRSRANDAGIDIDIDVEVVAVDAIEGADGESTSWTPSDVAPETVSVVDSAGRWLESVLCGHCLTFNERGVPNCVGCGAPLHEPRDPRALAARARAFWRALPMIALMVAGGLLVGFGIFLGWLFFGPLP